MGLNLPTPELLIKGFIQYKQFSSERRGINSASKKNIIRKFYILLYYHLLVSTGDWLGRNQNPQMLRIPYLKWHLTKSTVGPPLLGFVICGFNQPLSWWNPWMSNSQIGRADCVQFSSVSQSCSTLCDPMDRSTPGLPVHPSPTPGVHPNPCPLRWWCHPTISSSVAPFSSCPQSFPASGSFPMSQLFTSGGRSIGVSASTSVLPMNTQDWSPLGWTGWISLQSTGLSRVFFQHHSWKASILWCSAFFIVQLSHPCMTTGKTIALTRWIFVGKVMSLLFNVLSRVVIIFLPRSRCLLISWLQSPPAVILERVSNWAIVINHMSASAAERSRGSIEESHLPSWRKRFVCLDVGGPMPPHRETLAQSSGGRGLGRFGNWERGWEPWAGVRVGECQELKLQRLAPAGLGGSR